MIKKLLTLNMCMLVLHVTAQTYSADDISRWKQTAQNVTIIRDNWGIPHVYGKTDADAVFGLLYAQCEDDFSRVEMNYIDKLGRLSEVYGEKDLYQDVYTRLVIDSADAVHDYENSPAWLKSLLDAFADGINYFLYTHKNAHPLLLQYFKPWYALMWTDGSIGAISTGNITSRDVEALYTNTDAPVTTFADVMKENTDGSNGFAVSPFKTADGHAILYINPHVIFYFRPEVHMISQQGLDAYGAVT
ncbi:MAG TPA: penicillin acylase family protein, partial [Chitinophagaceae bacterium]|nr:penicillin acylase family protein [Chitinophagaceae bacterium]